MVGVVLILTSSNQCGYLFGIYSNIFILNCDATMVLVHPVVYPHQGGISSYTTVSLCATLISMCLVLNVNC